MDNNEFENKQQKTIWENVKFFKNLFFVIAASILFIFLLFNIKNISYYISKYIGYVMPVIYGVCIAYILNPIMVFFNKKFYKLFDKSKKEKTRNKAKKYSKNISIALAVLIGLLIVILLIVLIVPELINSLMELGAKLPDLLENVINWFNKKSFAETNWASSIQQILDKAVAALENWVENSMMPMLEGIMTNLIGYLTTGVVSVFSFFFNFLVGIVVAIYTLKDKEKFIGRIKKILYSTTKTKTANKIINTARHGHQIFGGFLYGKIIDSAIVGVICFLFNIIAGMPYSLLIAVIIGITNIIPFFGPFIGGIPSALLIFMINPMQGLVFAIFVFILQQIDGNIIGPLILGNTTGLSEFWVTFALLLFGGMFGFMGMIIGVPVFAVIYYLLRDYFNEKAKKKNFANSSAFFLDVDKYDPETGEFIMINYQERESSKAEKRDLKLQKRKDSFKKIIDKFKHKNKK
ncbi:AI-2E family transporter [Eubacteriales bacterium OttesenSCG-928-G02]|nr:AI-2E family transporter [Eubacteriales bacterium OttesenSCG-928-G02]